MAAPLVSLQDDTALENRRAQKRALDEFVNRWFHDSAEGTLIAAFHPFDSSAEFEERLEEHLRKLIQRRLPAATPDVQPTRATWTTGSPFRGLDTFEFEHAPVFFGRTRAVGDVLGALRLQAAAGRPFVLILGASGSGKSSLVRGSPAPAHATRCRRGRRRLATRSRPSRRQSRRALRKPGRGPVAAGSAA